MKKMFFLIMFCLLFSTIGFSEIEDDGFDVFPLISATKSFDAADNQLELFREFLESNLDNLRSSGYSDDDMENEETVYGDDNDNIVKMTTQKSIQTGEGTTTIKILGPAEFVNSFRAELK